MKFPVDQATGAVMLIPPGGPSHYAAIERFRALHARVCFRCGNDDPAVWRVFFSKSWRVLDYKFRWVLFREGFAAAEEFIRKADAVAACVSCFRKVRSNGEWKGFLELQGKEKENA